MYSSFHQLESIVKKSVLDGDYSSALDELKRFVVFIMNTQAAPGEVVGSRKVDELCEFVGDSYFSQFFRLKSAGRLHKSVSKRVVIVCTGLYKYGGTSLVISDLAKAHPDYECTVIATNYLDDMTDEDLELSRIGGSGATVSICPPGSADQKLNWLIRQFLEISPSRIFLLNHHQDSVIVSAAKPFLDRSKVIFYHHADYNMCLGVHLKGAIHVDPHNVGFYNCRARERICDNAYVPLTVEDVRINRVGTDFIGNGELTTCSSGHFLKFRNFYLYPYADLIVDRMRVRNGTHIHIGGLPDEDITHIRQKLIQSDVDAERFVHIPWTGSLWKTLIDQNVDLFIGSFPIGGARTTIEAMGAGIPLLMPDNYLSRFFSSRDIVYRDAFLWKYPKDFSDIITKITAKSLKTHSARSRAHYVINYSSECIDIKERIDAICADHPTSDPYELYPYNPDHLDRAMHFGRLDTLTSEYAVQLAVSGAARPGVLHTREQKTSSGKSRFTNAFSSLFNNMIGKPPARHAEAQRSPIRRNKRLRSISLSANGRSGGDTAALRSAAVSVNHLPADAQELHKALSESPGSVGFEPSLYLRRNPDVALAGVDPLLHFVEYGQHEGRAQTFFFSPDWHVEMNRIGATSTVDILNHLGRTRSDPTRMKVAFFAYAWNSARLPDAYMREMIASLADLGINVDVYIGGQFSRNEGTKGFRPDMEKSDLKAFLQSQSYDFAISFNNSLVLPETVAGLDCKIVSVIVDSIHHLFDHSDEGLFRAFSLPIHAAPIYTSFIEDVEGAVGFRASAAFLPAATRIEGRDIDTEQDPIAISWVASMLGDHNLDIFMSKIEDGVPDGLKLIAKCLSSIERTGRIGADQATQEAARTLCKWAQWDYPLLEMHLQEIVTNGMRLAVVERLAPLGLEIWGNTRWRAAATLSPGVVRAFRSGGDLRRHADLCAIYDRSRITINIPQVHAGTGMQYRVLDALASKSLLITKYVPDSDMERLFGADSPIVTFSDVDDLYAKCDYYLKNEEERLARVKECNAMVAQGYSFRERVLEYLALSNPSLAGQAGSAAGPGSATLIWPERITEWAAGQGRQAA